MNEMQIPIEIYQCLSDVARRHGITQTAWSKASDEKQPRIAELERLLKMSRGERERADIGRAFTILKLRNLYERLKKILGVATMQKELDACLSKESDHFRRIIIMAMAMYGTNNQQFLSESDRMLTNLYKHTKEGQG